MTDKILHEDGTVILTEDGGDLLDEMQSTPGQVIAEDGTGILLEDGGELLTEDASDSGNIVILRRRLMEVT